MAVSIRDVAKKAGVSPGTVSRAFNGYSDVNIDTKNHILQVAKELGYVPNLHAKNLSSKNKITVALIINDLLGDRENFHGVSFWEQSEKRGLNEISFMLMRGVCEFAEEHNLEIATYCINEKMQETKSYDQFCSEHSLSGAVVIGLKNSDNYYRTLSQSQTPCVTIDVFVEGSRIGYIGTDNVNSFDQMTQHLLDHGHREIVILSGKAWTDVCIERLEGARRAFERNGLTLNEDHVIFTEFRADMTEKIVADYLAKYGRKKATAFLCMSDRIAIAAIQTIKRAGYKVPRDFSVTGFDGLSISELMNPGITTINQNMQHKGYEGIKLLLSMIGEIPFEKKVFVPYQLVRRDSVSFLKQSKK